MFFNLNILRDLVNPSHPTPTGNGLNLPFGANPFGLMDKVNGGIQGLLDKTTLDEKANHFANDKVNNEWDTFKDKMKYLKESFTGGGSFTDKFQRSILGPQGSVGLGYFQRDLGRYYSSRTHEFMKELDSNGNDFWRNFGSGMNYAWDVGSYHNPMIGMKESFAINFGVNTLYGLTNPPRKNKPSEPPHIPLIDPSGLGVQQYSRKRKRKNPLDQIL
jgi:hypothetical protein